MRKVHFSFFWQLLFAFVITTLLMSISILATGHTVFRDLETEFRDRPPVFTEVWAERLGAYYARQENWDGLDTMIATYPYGEAWAPWDETWELPVIVADADGTIIFASDSEMVGTSIPPHEQPWTTPILQDGEVVGMVALPFFAKRPPADTNPDRDYNTWRIDIFENALKRFFLLEGLVIGASLLMGFLFSRRLSHPFAALHAATQAIGSGDFDVRVPTNYSGDVGELARAFNAMAEALNRSDELRRNMTADTAHELRTPLSVIRGKLEGILDGVYPATEAHLAPILEETELLTHLVEDLRLLALAEAGQLSLELQPLNVTGLIQDIQVNFTPQANDRGIILALDLPPELPKVIADWRRISQILSNLMTNALRHTPHGGVVTIAAGVKDEFLEISVSDTGTGISKEDLPYVFERFWRGERSRNRSSGGSGLGLAIARQLAMLHGGDIGVASALGKGSTFSFTLPLA